MSEFTCNSKELSEFLKSKGFKQLRVDKGRFIFESDSKIGAAIDEYKALKKRCMF